MKVLRVVLLALFSGSVVGEDFSAVNDTPADISFTALLLSQERKGTAVLAQELVNEGSLSLSATDIVAIRAELCGGLTNSMKFYLYAVEEDGSETLLREETENFQPFTVFGKTPPTSTTAPRTSSASVRTFSEPRRTYFARPKARSRRRRQLRLKSNPLSRR